MGWGGEPWGGNVNGQAVVVGQNGTPPTVSNFSPAEGTAVNPNTPIGFDVTDDTGEFRRIVVTVVYRNSGAVDVVHDGDNFVGRYASLSARSGIAGGYHYSVQRQGGWIGAPDFKVYAIDTSGNEAL
jgi:hypothetical protein